MPKMEHGAQESPEQGLRGKNKQGVAAFRDFPIHADKAQLC
jgi:hypothetical protein